MNALIKILNKHNIFQHINSETQVLCLHAPKMQFAMSDDILDNDSFTLNPVMISSRYFFKQCSEQQAGTLMQRNALMTFIQRGQEWCLFVFGPTERS